MRIRLVPKSSISDDRERPIRTLWQHYASFGAHHKNMNEDRPVLSAAKCKPMTLVSRNIRYMPGVSNLFDRGAKCTNFKLVAGRISNFTTNKTEYRTNFSGMEGALAPNRK